MFSRRNGSLFQIVMTIVFAVIFGRIFGWLFRGVLRLLVDVALAVFLYKLISGERMPWDE